MVKLLSEISAVPTIRLYSNIRADGPAVGLRRKVAAGTVGRDRGVGATSGGNKPGTLGDGTYCVTRSGEPANLRERGLSVVEVIPCRMVSSRAPEGVQGP